jgi:hypothetical protein
MQPVQSPFGASEKIFAPHFRQILVTRIIVAEISCFTVYCVKFGRALCPNHSNEMTQFVFNIAGSRNRVGNFLSQQRLIALPKSVKRLRHRIFTHAKPRSNVGPRRRSRFIWQQLR